jgi:hypothetical protein
MCDRLIDLDWHVEAYRAELDDAVICDGCYDRMGDGDLYERVQKIQAGKPFTKEQQEIIDQLTLKADDEP